MSANQDRLYELLPAIQRIRDVEQGYPLRALMRVVGEQVSAIEDNIGQLYDNWFIETAQDWAVPYIAELVGYQPVGEAGITSDGNSALGKVLTPRREVANILAFRRRKGSLALLELIADASAGWPARAVEFYTMLARAQNINHLKLDRIASASFMSAQRLAETGGPFDTLAHSVDIRRISSHRGAGHYNIPDVGLYVWRLKPYAMLKAPACCIEAEGRNCFSFSALGNDTPLFNASIRQRDPTAIADKINLPIAFSRRELEERSALPPYSNRASTAFYGQGKSIAIYVPNSAAANDADGFIPAENVCVADLSDWQARPPLGKIVMDPELGRFMLPMRDIKVKDVRVDYNYGFSADMGGGPFLRKLWQPKLYKLYPVSKMMHAATDFTSIGAAIAKWRQDQAALKPEPATTDSTHPDWMIERETLRSAVIEIVDDEAYTERLAIRLLPGEYLQIRAANGKRPLIRLLDQIVDQPDSFSIRGGTGSRLVLDGLMIAGNALRIFGPLDDGAEVAIEGDLCDITIRHCTLVPGWWLDCDCEPKQPTKPSIELEDSGAMLRISHSIIGAIHVFASERKHDAVEIEISDSIVDAVSQDRPAITASGGVLAFASLTVRRSTVIGAVLAHAIELAENSIFLDEVRVARKQVGCMRYCYVPGGSRTPRRYHCQPDLVVQKAEPDESGMEASRVAPIFTSLRYGKPSYCQLPYLCAAEIKRGADDESEMGAFHDLFQPQREAILRARVNEYTPADMDAGIIFVN
jgi:hypothetical protein